MTGNEGTVMEFLEPEARDAERDLPEIDPDIPTSAELRAEMPRPRQAADPWAAALRQGSARPANARPSRDVAPF